MYGNLDVSKLAVEAVVEATTSGKANGMTKTFSGAVLSILSNLAENTVLIHRN